jgi:DNA-binding NtrC family response regulator
VSSEHTTIFRDHRIRLLLGQDQAMPDISGLEMIDSLQKIAPHLKYILISGLSQTLSARELEQLGIGAFCQKPITPANLIRVVREVLEQPRPPI